MGSVTRTWTATDDCGNMATESQTITFSDTEGPMVDGCDDNSLLLVIGEGLEPLPPFFILTCSLPATVDFSATDNCSDDLNLLFDYTLDLFMDGTIDTSDNDLPNNSSLLIEYPIGIHLLTYTVTDDCDNQTTCTKTIEVRDEVSPTIFCLQRTAVLDPVTGTVTFEPSDMASNFIECELESTKFLLNDGSIVDNVVFECADYIGSAPTHEIFMTVIATDIWGNISTCGNFVTLALPSPDFCNTPPTFVQTDGTLFTESMEMVEGVNVMLEGAVEETSTTSADGQYSFNDLPMDLNYSITPSLNEDHLNGVSTYDIVLISRHILGLELLDSPYKRIAADINNSGSITTFDLVELRKLILFIDTEFQQNESWRFVPADFLFPEPSNPFLTIFPEQEFINGLSQNEEIDFVAIKIGDVNQTVVPNGLLAPEERDFKGQLVFGVEDVEISANETYEVAFTAENFEQIQGYQFSLQFDQQLVSFIDLKMGSLPGLSLANFGLSLLPKGIITTSWAQAEAVSRRTGEELFYLTFTARENVRLSKVLQISNRYTIAEAYDVESSLKEVALRFDEGAIAENTFHLYQNRPNPFHQETLIGFQLPRPGFVKLIITDASGKELQRIEKHFPKGYNNISVTDDELSSGLLYYKMTTPGFSETKRMIFQR